MKSPRPRTGTNLSQTSSLNCWHRKACKLNTYPLSRESTIFEEDRERGWSSSRPSYSSEWMTSPNNRFHHFPHVLLVLFCFRFITKLNMPLTLQEQMKKGILSAMEWSLTCSLQKLFEKRSPFFVDPPTTIIHTPVRVFAQIKTLCVYSSNRLLFVVSSHSGNGIK